MTPNLSLLRSILVFATFALASPHAAFSAEPAPSAIEKEGFVARQWMEAFKKLDARNNITMVLSNRDSFYELENVVSIEAYASFLLVRCELPSGPAYHALVYPGTIMLIKETPRGVSLPRKPMSPG